MFRGLYSGASAMNNLERQHQITSSNLAHVNTNGHRRALFSLQENQSNNAAGVPLPGATLSSNVDFSNGRLAPTQRKLDLALSGEGFFKFQGFDGPVYTRNGALYRGADGTLQNREGLPLVGQDGPIVVPPEISERSIFVDSEGTVSANGEELGAISLVKFDNNQLLTSDSFVDFRLGQATEIPVEDAVVLQGNLEKSNATPITELISLIIGSRHFEAAQKAITAIDESIQRSTQS